MIYQPLGKTNLRVSRLGFGAMRLPMIGTGKEARVDDQQAVELIHHAFQAGVNYIDTAVFYCNHDSQRAVGLALKGWRDKIIVSTKNDYKGTDEKLWWKNLEDSLRLLDIDCIDVYNIHGISYQCWCELGEQYFAKWLAKARDQGMIRHICASTHDNNEGLVKLVDTGFFGSITLQYNMLDRQLEGGIAHAREMGVGVTVMGPLAGGRLAVPTEAFASVLPAVRRVPELALRFVLANPGVTLAISGMTSKQAIDENVALASQDSSLSPADLLAIDQHLQKLKSQADHYCTGCNYCTPCPRGVRIPRIFRTYNLARVYGLWDRARLDYSEILRDPWDADARQADACNDCGACEAKCPQKLPIRKQLEEAHKALSKP